MEEWQTELTADGHSLGQVKINRGIFPRDSLSPLLFVLCMIPLTLLLQKTKHGYEFQNRDIKINYLFMDDLKPWQKCETD